MSGSIALVVDRRGAAIELGAHQTMIVRHASGVLERVGLRALGSIVLNGNVTLDTEVLRAVADHGIALVSFPLRGWAQGSTFTALATRLARLRHAQHMAYGSSSARLALAKAVALAKLESMRLAVEEQGMPWDNFKALHAVERAEDIAQLMGVEGAWSRLYYDALRTRITGPFSFTVRQRRPPRDPVNALMSLTYTLLEAAAAQLALRAGLDVQVGYLHGIFRDRQSLALDLIEPARVSADCWLASLLCTRGLIKPSMFSVGEDEACRLDKAGREIFYQQWFSEGIARAMPHLRRQMAMILANLRRCPFLVEPESNSGEHDKQGEA